MVDESTSKSEDGDETIGNFKKSGSSASHQSGIDDTLPGGDETDSPIESPQKPDPPEIDEAEARDFLQKKGAVEILAQLADGGKRFNEINEALIVSHGTISTRLTEGAKLKLWRELITYPDDGGKIKLYSLSSAAQPLAEIAEAANIRQTTEQLRQAKDQHEDALSEFQDDLE